MTTLSLTLPDLSTEAWPAPPPGGRFRIGSEAHKRLFCKTLLDTFDPYRPAVMDWPKLEPEALRRLTSLPIWDIAVQTEGRAMRRVKAYGDVLKDELLNRAVALNAYEEGRHKVVLSHLVQAYGIRLEPEPEYRTPKDPEWAFMVTGFSECIDSFFAFGLFAAAKQTGFFPEELVETFEPVIQEEGRHILFFVNWVAWHRRNMPLWRRPWFELKVCAVWLFLAWERMSIAKGLDSSPAQDNNFTVTGAQELGADIGVGQLIDLCLVENDRRLGKYDPRLIRPMFMPRMARLAQGVMRLFEKRRA